MNSKHVCVLGAGIVGLATAWQLQRDGYSVTIVDRAAPGSGTSSGNGAQLSYSYVQPLADPSIWAQLPKLLLAPDSPLKLRPRLDPAQWRWGLSFLGACNAVQSRETTARLLALAAASRTALEGALSELSTHCDFSQTGKLVLQPTLAALEGARQQVLLQSQLGGAPQEVLDAAQCVAIEPALDGYRQHFAGAVYTPSECAIDSLKLCQSLAEALVRKGAQVHLNCEVQGFRRERGLVTALRTSAGDLQADAFVMALGSDSPRLARMLGVGLAVYPLKGYSITLDVDPGAGAHSAPRVSVTDTRRKVVFARLGDRLRVAGMAELVGHDRTVAPERIQSLADAARALFPACSRFETLNPWAGLRPATPTGQPIIGRIEGAPTNLLFNTGHGALGLTLAFGSAVQVVNELG
ncbi:D-amino acid dehydrogenase [Variovorax dokdonensis]|uniref:D-amino acid dehydrogenase n=1 Tax=Variovorax dokdonensis TaxID=344883 RepID=A0ABT7NBZ5_9BURK|nr:D-amino acid dehydrogenase [Variovorax dokdonensis]MDM0045464.1 D-amino acid dehydrogenase [Variovorax dokdonensis]